MADAFDGPSFKDKIRKALQEMAEDPFDREFDQLISDVALRDPTMFPASYRGWFGPYAENLNIQVPKSQVVGLASSEVPIGSIITWPFSDFDSIYLACDGEAVSRAQYPTLNELCAADAYPWGNGDGSSTFNVPDFRAQVMVGLHSGQAPFDTVAETGGESTHVLTESELAPHVHVPETGSFFLTTIASGGSFTVGAGSGITASDSTSAAGSGSAHNNLQPYTVVNFLIRAL